MLFSKAAEKSGYDVCAAAHVDETSEELEKITSEIIWIKVGQINKIISFFHEQGVTEAVMAGGITKKGMFNNFEPDERALKIVSRLKNLNDNTLLSELALELETEGIIIKPAHMFTPELLASPGVLTKREPTPEEAKDMDFGWGIAKSIGRLDVGQCIVVRNLVVLAVEAIEGTDKTISRGGELAGGSGAVVIKVSKPDQDFRFDLPALGPQTIKTMIKAGAVALVLEANKTLLFERGAMISLADEAGITILVREDG